MNFFLCQWQDKLESTSSSSEEISLRNVCNTYILTRGRAWAISLIFRSTIREEILKLCFPSDGDATDENLLYRFVLFPF